MVFANQLSLLSHKKEIIVLNVSEDEYNPQSINDVIKKYAEMLHLPEEKFVAICLTWMR